MWHVCPESLACALRDVGGVRLIVGNVVGKRWTGSVDGTRGRVEGNRGSCFRCGVPCAFGCPIWPTGLKILSFFLSSENGLLACLLA